MHWRKELISSSTWEEPCNNTMMTDRKFYGTYEVKKCLGPAGKNIVTGRRRYPCVGNVLSRGGTRINVVWIGVRGNLRGNNEDGLGNPCMIN